MKFVNKVFGFHKHTAVMITELKRHGLSRDCFWRTSQQNNFNTGCCDRRRREQRMLCAFLGCSILKIIPSTPEVYTRFGNLPGDSTRGPRWKGVGGVYSHRQGSSNRLQGWEMNNYLSNMFLFVQKSGSNLPRHILGTHWKQS